MEYLKLYSSPADALQINTSSTTSDYSALSFLISQFGPLQIPTRHSFNYQRLFDIADGPSQTAALNLTVASLVHVDG